MLKIDGSFGEGGGQILRSSLAMSAITSMPLEINKIRAKRKKPGLMAQHLTAVHAAAAVTQAEVKGAQVKSQDLSFIPKALTPGKFAFNVADVYTSAGSTSLIFQTILAPLSFTNTPSHITLKGGTNVPWSPPFPYLEHVFLPTVAQMGIEAKVTQHKAGWYPEGGGEITAQIQPIKGLQPLQLNQRGKLKRLYCISGVSNLPIKIAQRQRERAFQELRQLKPIIEITDIPSPGRGTIFFILAQFELAVAGFTALGEKGKPAELVAQEACEQLRQFLDSNAAIDQHLADQLIPYMVLANGTSSFSTSKITQHLLTNLFVVKKFVTLQSEVQGKLSEPGQMTIKGIGYQNRLL